MHNWQFCKHKSVMHNNSPPSFFRFHQYMHKRRNSASCASGHTTWWRSWWDNICLYDCIQFSSFKVECRALMLALVHCLLFVHCFFSKKYKKLFESNSCLQFPFDISIYMYSFLFIRWTRFTNSDRRDQISHWCAESGTESWIAKVNNWQDTERA